MDLKKRTVIRIDFRYIEYTLILNVAEHRNIYVAADQMTWHFFEHFHFCKSYLSFESSSSIQTLFANSLMNLYEGMIKMC